jgi:hypothetical protein
VQAGDKEISRRKYKNLRFRFLLIAVLVLVAGSSFFIACNSDNPLSDNTEFETYLSLSKPDFDFGRDWESLSESDKNTFNLAQKRMDFTFDENGICTTKWTSSSQVNMSDELFNCFISIIDVTNEVTKQLSETQEIKLPRLKSGNECNPSEYSSRINNCLVQAIHYVCSSRSYTSIDNYICNNNYYIYNAGRWHVNGLYVSAVLYHFLSGKFVKEVKVGDLTSGCILILNGSIGHAVVYKYYNTILSEVNYYDPSGTSGKTSCAISDIAALFQKTGCK